MILKGCQRASGADLATHLMNAFDNEHVEIAEVSGTVAGDLHGAFAEFEAIATGTKAREYLYSLSINPSAPISRDQYAEAIGLIEARLGLSGQPRAVVFHVKRGREHCHVVWSRIDADRMRAVHLSHDRRKLCDLACELAGRYGLELPPGLKAWQEKQSRERERLEPTPAENAQAVDTGISPAQRQADITAAYEASDTPLTFRNALFAGGYILARGDRRGFVVVDRFGHIHSLTRYIKGHKAKAIKERLAGLDSEDLPTAAEAQEKQKEKLAALSSPNPPDHVRQDAIRALKAMQAERRKPLVRREQELLTRHAAERLSLKAAQQSERESRLFRVATAVMRLIVRMPGLRCILAPITQNPHINPAQRHDLEISALAQRHARERAALEREKDSMDAVEARELRSLERKLRWQAGDAASRIPRHEHEDLHRLHMHLKELRREIEADKTLTQNFNERAGYRKPPDTDSWDHPNEPRNTFKPNPGEDG